MLGLCLRSFLYINDVYTRWASTWCVDRVRYVFYLVTSIIYTKDLFSIVSVHNTLYIIIYYLHFLHLYFTLISHYSFVSCDYWLHSYNNIIDVLNCAQAVRNFIGIHHDSWSSAFTHLPSTRSYLVSRAAIYFLNSHVISDSIFTSAI